MTTVAYASSVRLNVNVMLLKGHAHSSKEEEKRQRQPPELRNFQRQLPQEPFTSQNAQHRRTPRDSRQDGADGKA